ncbi:hypothetical protein KIN20_011756 [Parelaphostrongylus tenuis]|uniref:Uncharacterized protein n=1 Tax=Parelaphostrongylus tenuis TaxID=148309 RepID=A0AAD5MDG3_PARTN|nr:hypothetical protein KIN20_011756 [Parelaphostrongylus tenuis]
MGISNPECRMKLSIHTDTANVFFCINSTKELAQLRNRSQLSELNQVRKDSEMMMG